MGTETNATIRLRVLPVKPLPHVITIPINGVQTTLTFTPDCDTPIPAARAEALLKSYPGLFEIPTGPFDPTLYVMKTSFKKETLIQAIQALEDSECLGVYEHIQNIIANRGKASGAGAAEGQAPKLAEMTKAQLLDLAAEMKLEVPAGINKTDLLLLIEKASGAGAAGGNAS